MNNLYVDIAPFFGNSLSGFNPYVFGGVGVSWNSTSDSTIGLTTPLVGSATNRTAFAWNAGAGIQWQMTRNFIFDLGYRYLDAGRFASAPTAGFPFGSRWNNEAHQIMFSLVVPFAGLTRALGN